MTEHVTWLELGAPLGNGHYGQVFSALDPVRGAVAVKVIARHPGEPDAQWFAKRDGALQEAQRLAAATHRNVVQVYGCMQDTAGESVRFTMALCMGGSLQASFDQGPMKVSTVRKVATDVTFGLQALHQRGMLHRDIKPANILLDAEGVAMLGDFGWVTDEILMGYAVGGGYADHLAYEAWQHGVATVRTDVWALGMTLFRLLHGKNWYERQARPTSTVAQGGFANRLDWLPHIPDKWRRVLRRMLEDDTAKRYQNCEQLLAAFADLPVESDWECFVTDDLVSWSRTVGKRLQKVEWRTHSARKHEWTAWSEPLGAGQNRTLAGSDGIVGRTDCLKQLRSFFAQH